MRFLSCVICITLSAGLVGCSKNDEQAAKITELEHRMSLAEAETATLKKEIQANAEKLGSAASKTEEIRADLKKTQSDLSTLASGAAEAKNGATWAELTPGGRGYGVTQSPLGSFTVSLRTITPYLGGFRVVLDVGNTLGAAVDSANLAFAYSPEKGGREKLAQADVGRIMAGTRKPVEILIPKAEASELSYFRVCVVPGTLLFPEQR